MKTVAELTRQSVVKPVPVKPADVANSAQEATTSIAAPLMPAVPGRSAEPVAPSPTPAPAPAPEVKPESPSVTPAPVKPAPAPATTWKDGTYTGWGSCRHGDIQASVVIKAGRIESATISDCRTRYSCSVIDILPPEVPQRQSPEVDYVSGATQSANAFYYAVLDALSKAK